MGKHSHKRRHVESSSSSDSGTSSPPVRKRKKHSRSNTDDKLKRLIRETLLEMHGEKSPVNSKKPSVSDVSDNDDDAFPDEQKGKYVSKEMLKTLFHK